ncbi:MAG: acyl-CoA thioesterase [Bacteroidia bacterium]
MELITTYICKEFDIGIHDNMFGGRIMSLVDDSSGSYAAQLCDTPRMVTIKFDSLIFKKPVKVGNILKIYGRVLTFGRTSVELYMEVRKHNVYTGEQEIVTHTNVKFVRVDEEGKAIPLSERVIRRYEERYRLFGKGLLTPEETEREVRGVILN